MAIIFTNRHNHDFRIDLKSLFMNNIDKPIATLKELLGYNAQSFTAAEVELRNSLPVWIAQVSSQKLRSVLEKYHRQVEEHVQKFEKFFEAEGINSFSVANKIMLAFIEETNQKLNRCANQEVKDACLLACIQAINHFKISVYGTAAAFAKQLEMGEFAKRFHEAEVNEKQIDEQLSQLAKHEINSDAEVPIILSM
jgi:ferritin-like metal-binding protein YciE